MVDFALDEQRKREIEKPIDRGQVMATAEVFAAAYKLVGLVDGKEGAGIRWTNGYGLRLKDTTEWVTFYSAVKEFERTGAAP